MYISGDDLNMSTFEPSVMFTKRFGIYAIPENFADLERPVRATDIIYARNYLPYVIISNVNTGELFCSERKYNVSITTLVLCSRIKASGFYLLVSFVVQSFWL